MFIILFKTDPYHFHALSREDYPLEWASAILMFLACFIFVFLFFKNINVKTISNYTKLLLAVFSILFLLIAMEEVSWFQRVLKIETPDSFKNNLQGEMNFHNFYSELSENIYYFGAFIFLIFLPTLKLILPRYLNFNEFKLLIPRPFIVIIATIAYSYNFDMWNAVITQTTFYSCIIILFGLFIYSSNRNEKRILVFIILLLIFQQIIFLNNPANFVRLWEITEYKEFFISLSFFVYSFNVLMTFNLIRTSKT